MIESILSQHNEAFGKALDRFQHELSTVRTGRANPALLATVIVESYGTKLPLQQVASVTVSDAKTLVVTPWDKSQLQAVEKGIMAANLGFTPNNDGSIIRINLPPLNEERRKEMVKLVGQMAENARIAVRQIREEVMKAIKKAENAGKISEDDVNRGQKKLQEEIDKYNQRIKDTSARKEKEIMTV